MSQLAQSLRRHWRLVTASVLLTGLAVLVILNFVTGEKKIEQPVERLYGTSDPQFLRVMGALLGPPVLGGNRYQVLRNRR